MAAAKKKVLSKKGKKAVARPAAQDPAKKASLAKARKPAKKSAPRSSKKGLTAKPPRGAQHRPVTMVPKTPPPPAAPVKEVAERALDLLRDPDGTLPRFREMAEDVGLSIPALKERLASITPASTFTDLFPSHDAPPHYTWSGRATLTAMLLRKAQFPLAADVVFGGDLRVSDRLFVPGNLVVKGRLTVYGTTLVVMGNVQVDVFEDEYASVAIGGDFSAARALYTQAFLGVAGQTKAPFVCLDFNQGFAKLLGGCAATVLIESDHGGSRIFGPVTAGYVSVDELRTDVALSASPPEALAELLHADARDGALAKIADFDLGSYLWTALGEGKRLFP